MTTAAATQRISEQAQAIAAGLDATLRETVGKRVRFFLVIYTNPRANYVGNTTAEERRELVAEVLARWNGADPGANLRVVIGNEKPSRLERKFVPQLHQFLDGFNELLADLAGEPVPWSLILSDAPHPAIYLAKAAREDVKPEFESLLAMWAAGMPDVPAHKVS